jgi:hypothetical protein
VTLILSAFSSSLSAMMPASVVYGLELSAHDDAVNVSSTLTVTLTMGHIDACHAVDVGIVPSATASPSASMTPTTTSSAPLR